MSKIIQKFKNLEAKKGINTPTQNYMDLAEEVMKVFPNYAERFSGIIGLQNAKTKEEVALALQRCPATEGYSAKGFREYLKIYKDEM